jgi:5-oxoprolinase (ATP-hydrolysing) subunit C
MIEILSTTALTMVQDLGREGHRRYGVGTAGAMDRIALAAGNAMLGSDDGAAGIEIQVFPFQARFLADLNFAMTGADCHAQIGGRAMPSWWTATARKGEVLSLGIPNGATRGYLTLAGGIDVPVVLGSRSTQLRGEIGGYHGRMLERGDILKVLPAAATSCGIGFGIEPPQLALPMVPGASSPNVTVVRVISAAEYDRFDAHSLETFWSTHWQITPQSNRYGYRLRGPALSMREAVELRSHGIVPGIIQVPAGGQPIIQLSDAQTAGGYPKIGSIIEADLWRVGQAPLGSSLRFIRATHAEAIDAYESVGRYLAHVRSVAARHRLRLRLASVMEGPI